MTVRIITRSEWRARPPKRTPYRIATPTPELWLHHEASVFLADGVPIPTVKDLARLRAIQDYHMDVKRWNDIAYSFLVDPDGVIFEGRGFGVAGGHTKNHNTISHGICAIGDYHVGPPPSAMLASIASLIVYGYENRFWSSQLTGGHRDVSSTACPGNFLYPQIPIINQMVLGEDDMTTVDWVKSLTADQIRALVAVGLVAGNPDVWIGLLPNPAHSEWVHFRATVDINSKIATARPGPIPAPAPTPPPIVFPDFTVTMTGKAEPAE